MKLAPLLALGLALIGCGGGGGRSAPARSPAPRRAASATAPAAGAAAPAPDSPAAVAAPTEGSATPAPPEPGQQAVFVPSATDQVFVRRMLDVIDEVASVMERHQDACDRMAAALEVVLRRNQDLIHMAQQMKGNPGRDKWMQDQAMGRLEKALPRMMAGFQKCQNDTRMQALMRQLGS